jgi:type III secretion protein C
VTLRVNAAIRAAFLVLLSLGLCPPASLAGVPARFKESGYAFNAEATPVTKILGDLVKGQGMQLKVSGQFREPISGRIQGATVSDFLDNLAIAGAFQWFTYGNSLYVSPIDDTVVERLEMSAQTADQVKTALTGLGLYEPKFGWGELAEEGVIYVSGPSEYVRLVKQVLQPEKRLDELQAMVFRLKHASAVDRTVWVRDEQVVTPGVATILRGMLDGRRDPKSSRQATMGFRRDNAPGGFSSSPVGGSPVATDEMAGPLKSLMGTGMAMPSAGAPTAASQSAMMPRSRSTVEGDARTNSVVVFDVVTRRDYYQRLVSELDVPQRLIEIEAQIVDIDRHQLDELGAKLGYRDGSVSGRVDTINGLASALVPGASISLRLNSFFAQLRAMETNGNAQILARPSVLTLENMTAVLDLSQTVYVRATGERVAQILPVTAGTLLRVNARLIDESEASPRMHLDVDIEDGTIAPAPNGGDPQVQRSTVSTQAVLANQESLLIGGYNFDGTSKETNQIPVVGKVPLLGTLFSNKQDSRQNRQRLFIITPRLVQAVARDVAPGGREVKPAVDAKQESRTSKVERNPRMN